MRLTVGKLNRYFIDYEIYKYNSSSHILQYGNITLAWSWEEGGSGDLFDKILSIIVNFDTAMPIVKSQIRIRAINKL